MHCIVAKGHMNALRRTDKEDSYDSYKRLHMLQIPGMKTVCSAVITATHIAAAPISPTQGHTVGGVSFQCDKG